MVIELVDDDMGERREAGLATRYGLHLLRDNQGENSATI